MRALEPTTSRVIRGCLTEYYQMGYQHRVAGGDPANLCPPTHEHGRWLYMNGAEDADADMNTSIDEAEPVEMCGCGEVFAECDCNKPTPEDLAMYRHWGSRNCPLP